MKTLKIAIQKSGRLNEKSVEILKNCGLSFENYKSSLISTVTNFPLEILFLRDDDIPEYVQDGIADLGIVGENVIVESGSEVTYLQKLGFGKCTLKIAIPNESHITEIAQLEGKAIATSYPVILEKYLKDNHVDAEVRTISGSVEIGPGLGLSDAICDIVSTGGTLKSNGLKPFSEVMKSEAILIGKEGSELLPEVQELLQRIRSVLRAKETKIVLFYGYPFFEEIKGSRSKIRGYQEKRKIAYLGSPQHFFRSLYNNSVDQEGFVINKLVKAPNKDKLPDTIIKEKIKFFSDVNGEEISPKNRKDSLNYWFVMKNKPDTVEVMSRGNVLIDTLVKQKLSSLKTLNYKDALYIVYKKEKETRSYARNSGYKIERPREYSRFQISLVYQLKPSINFYENGGIYDPGSLLFEGVWGYEKVADMVPMDYKVEEQL